MGYSDGEALILTQVQACNNFDSTNTSRANWKILNQGKDDHYAILRPGPFDIEWIAFDTYRANWVTVIEVWQRYKDETDTHTDLYDRVEDLFDILGVPLLGDTTGTIQDSTISVQDEPEEMWMDGGGPGWLRWKINILWREESNAPMSITPTSQAGYILLDGFTTNKKVSQLDPITTPNIADYIHVVEDGTTSKYMTYSNFMNPQHAMRFGTSQTTEGALIVSSLDTADWHIAADQITNEGQPDDVLYIGFNRNAVDNTKLDDTQHSWYMVLEADYYTSPTAHQTEWYVEYTPQNSDTGYRPFICSVNIDTNIMECTIKGKTSIFYDNDNQAAYFDTDGSFYMVSKPVIANTNDVAFLKQKNAAGDAIVSLMYIAGDNRVIMGESGYKFWFTDDVQCGSATKGFILIDRTSGSYYRLYVDNGALAIEAA